MESFSVAVKYDVETPNYHRTRNRNTGQKIEDSLSLFSFCHLALLLQ